MRKPFALVGPTLHAAKKALVAFGLDASQWDCHGIGDPMIPGPFQKIVLFGHNARASVSAAHREMLREEIERWSLKLERNGQLVTL